MKFNRLSIALGIVLLMSQGCGKSDDKPSPSGGPVATPAAAKSYSQDKASFLAAFDLYNQVGADDSGNFTRDDKIAACVAYIAEAENMIAKYSDREEQPGGVEADLARVKNRKRALEQIN